MRKAIILRIGYKSKDINNNIFRHFACPYWLVRFILILVILSNASAGSNEYKFCDLIECWEASKKYGDFITRGYLDPINDLELKFRKSFQGIRIQKGEYLISIKYKQKDTAEWARVLLDEVYTNTRKICFKNIEYFSGLEKITEKELDKIRDIMFKKREIYLINGGSAAIEFEEGELAIYIFMHEDGLNKDFSEQKGESLEGESIYFLETERIELRDGGDVRKTREIKPQEGDQLKIEIFQMMQYGEYKKLYPYIRAQKSIPLAYKQLGIKVRPYGFMTFKSKLTLKKLKIGIPPLEGLCANIYLDYRSTPDESTLCKIITYPTKFIGLHIGFPEALWKGGMPLSLGLALSFPEIRKYFSFIVGYGPDRCFGGIAVNSTWIDDIIKKIFPPKGNQTQQK
jgi:hypothetical protein